MKQTFFNIRKIADACAAMQMYMGLDIGHLFHDGESGKPPRV